MARTQGPRHSLRRRLERWSAWQSVQLDSLTGLVTRRLDALNRALAKQSVPRSRRERVENLLRERQQRKPSLEVIRGGEDDSADDS